MVAQNPWSVCADEFGEIVRQCDEPTEGYISPDGIEGMSLNQAEADAFEDSRSLILRMMNGERLELVSRQRFFVYRMALIAKRLALLMEDYPTEMAKVEVTFWLIRKAIQAVRLRLVHRACEFPRRVNEH